MRVGSCILSASILQRVRAGSIHSAIICAREWTTVILQFVDALWCLPSHIVNGILITEPIRAFHGIVHVPPPVILVHTIKVSAGLRDNSDVLLLSQGRVDASLGGHGMTPRREQLRDTRGIKTRFGQAESGAQTGPAGTNHNGIVFMILPRLDEDEGGFEGQRTMMGYLLETNGEASFARRGWLATILAAGRVEEKRRRLGMASWRWRELGVGFARAGTLTLGALARLRRRSVFILAMRRSQSSDEGEMGELGTMGERCCRDAGEEKRPFRRREVGVSGEIIDWRD